MAGVQLERSASTVRENMAAFQRSASSVKLDQSSTPILTRTSSMIAAEAKLKISPSISPKDVALLSSGPGIRNRNIVIGLLSTLLILAVSWHSFAPDEIPAYEAATGDSKWSHGGRAMPYTEFVQKSLIGAQKFLVQDPEMEAKYHGGPLLIDTINVHTIFYGSWTRKQRAIITEFIQSFGGPKPRTLFPTVAGWWAITKGFKDKNKKPVAQKVVLGKIVHDKYSVKKKTLKEADIEALVAKHLKTINPKFVDPTAIYLVLTSADVGVQGFCSSQCGTHSYTRSPATEHKVLPFVWVGNPSKSCPGHCAWPYAKAEYGAGPNTPPLKAPNGDVGVDGMCITIASMIAGAATNTRGNGYYQGSAYDAYEAVAMCGGIYGSGAYPGYAGKLLKTSAGASYNVNGFNGRKYLLPFIFNPVTKKCALQ